MWKTKNSPRPAARGFLTIYSPASKYFNRATAFRDSSFSATLIFMRPTAYIVMYEHTNDELIPRRDDE